MLTFEKKTDEIKIIRGHVLIGRYNYLSDQWSLTLFSTISHKEFCQIFHYDCKNDTPFRRGDDIFVMSKDGVVVSFDIYQLVSLNQTPLGTTIELDEDVIRSSDHLLKVRELVREASDE